MTAIVGIRCTDGVVIGSDSSATFGDGHAIRTIEQTTSSKIELIGSEPRQVIVAGTGFVGHMQRFSAAVTKCWTENKFRDKTDLEVGKMLSFEAIKDFRETQLQRFEFSALVAYVAKGEPVLCELLGGASPFQPEIKRVGDLWFTSAGSGQPITDPFLALMRKVFWRDGAPTIQGGVFTTLWALQHACEVNPGGINAPIRIAVLSSDKGKLRAKELDESELAEHGNMVSEATKHMAGFRDILEGRGVAAEVPKPT